MPAAVPLHVHAQAVPAAGAGHVMRCIPLLEAWARAAYGPVSLSGRIGIPFVRRRIDAAGIPVSDAPPARLDRAVLILDDYDGDARASAATRDDAALRVLVDDLGEPVPPGYDVIWNPNLYAGDTMYPRFAGTVLAGPDTVPMRALPPWRRRAPGAVAVMLGGMTPAPPVLRALAALAADRPETEWAAAGDWAERSWRRLPPEDPWGMPDAVFGAADCGMAIIAAGTTTWEAAGVGIPLVSVRTAPNQSLVWRYASGKGIPVVDALDADDPRPLARALAEALPRARPLPQLRNGAPHVARALHRLALGARHGTARTAAR